MKENFRIINLVKEMIENFDKYLINFPHKDIELKRNLYETSYHLLKLLYECNSTTNLDLKTTLQDKIIADIKFIDFTICRSFKRQIINEKRYIKFGTSLGYIYASVLKWKRA